MGAAAKNRSLSSADPGLFLFLRPSLRCRARFEVKPSYIRGHSPRVGGERDVHAATLVHGRQRHGEVPAGNYDFKMTFQVRSLGTYSILVA